MRPIKSRTRFNNLCIRCEGLIPASSRSIRLERRSRFSPFGLLVLTALLATLGFSLRARGQEGAPATVAVKVDPSQDLGSWEGWGSSLAWWGRAIGGTGNADYYADLIYTTKTTDNYPGLGLNIVRYNIGGGGVNQPQENKGPKLQWY